MTEISKGYQYDPILVYAVDWHQYHGQHDPKGGEPYKAIKGWIAGFLIEESPLHLVIALTSFDNGDVRDVLVIPKCSVIETHRLECIKLPDLAPNGAGKNTGAREE